MNITKAKHVHINFVFMKQVASRLPLQLCVCVCVCARARAINYVRVLYVYHEFMAVKSMRLKRPNTKLMLDEENIAYVIYKIVMRKSFEN
jgi:hypothetical protein